MKKLLMMVIAVLVVAVLAPQPAAAECKAALETDSSAPAPRMTTDTGSGVIEYPAEYCGKEVGVGKKTYALQFVDACFPNITLSSGEILVRATTSFHRVPQSGWLAAMQIFFRNAAGDPFQTDVHVFDSPIPFSGCADIVVNLQAEPVYTQAGKKQVGTVSLTRIKLAP